MWQGNSCVVGDMHGSRHDRGHGSGCSRGHGRGTCMAWGCACLRGMRGKVGCVCVAGETAIAADGTHPTRMHSCCALFLLFMHIIENNHISVIKFIKFSNCSWN